MGIMVWAEEGVYLLEDGVVTWRCRIPGILVRTFLHHLPFLATRSDLPAMRKFERSLGGQCPWRSELRGSMEYGGYWECRYGLGGTRWSIGIGLS